jgi:repressor LexA
MSSKKNHSEIGIRIKEIRLSRGLTQKSFATSLGIVQGFLSDVERGRKLPSETLLIALCHLYEISEE